MTPCAPGKPWFISTSRQRVAPLLPAAATRPPLGAQGARPELALSPRGGREREGLAAARAGEQEREERGDSPRPARRPTPRPPLQASGGAGPPAPRRLARAGPAPGIALLRTGGSGTERSRQQRSRRRSARLPPVRAEPREAAEKPRAPPGERRPAATAGGGRAGRAEPAAGSGGGGRRVPANMALCRPVARPGWR